MDDEIKNWTERDLIIKMSHEIRNPVAVALGFATVLKQSWNDLSDQERNHILDILISRLDSIKEVNDWAFTWQQSHSS